MLVLTNYDAKFAVNADYHVTLHLSLTDAVSSTSCDHRSDALSDVRFVNASGSIIVQL